ncbi:2-dehydro-3-deoxygalactonokinase [Mucilaginibacter sp.]|uniref:2-dehydro-3-deoxygalactonokinase n=1 Tax=Mucilaginibacter sp. TaxID=1882438 RepID=UPI002639ECB1|nr:2-dehydro-3-deoxygalactonokinase [Mucilaginibacter sp.]MDB4923787.1 2-keto-3-deoxy-galactonokinase [Mucilaginibacter sp.]
MNDFLSCDWGTSTLRISLVNGSNGGIICTESADQGMAGVYNLWLLTGDAGIVNRILFYLGVLQQHIKSISSKTGRPLNGHRLIISGMASSSIGFIELPYSELPFSLTGEGLQMKHLPAQEGFGYEVTVISGVKSNDDVMRGEETQLMGCVNINHGNINNQVFLLPGTHSKHICINNNQVTGFKTYMTGDFFGLLSQKSILSNSVEKEDNMENADCLKAFLKGVTDSANLNLLNAAFKVRTNSLFDVYTKKQNFNYLSGLLIGSELQDLNNFYTAQIHLLCGGKLEHYYSIALKALGFADKLQTYPAQWVDEAVARAHYHINKQLEANHG